MNDLPSFLVIGSMKGGTTSLYHYLGAHPQVFMPRLKEVDFFTAELNWSRGWDWYRKQFKEAPAGTRAVGEASTSYTKFPRYTGVPARIAESLPEVRLIYVVRDPVQRIRSHYQHNVTLGEETDPLAVAVKKNPAYLDYSRYAMQIDRYLEHFDRDALLVVTSEALRSERVATVRSILGFIGVDADLPIPTLEEEYYTTEQRPAYGPVATSVRNALRRMFPGRVGLWRGTWVPAPIKQVLATAPPAERSQGVDDDTRALIHAELKADVDRLRRYVADGFDGWGIA